MKRPQEKGKIPHSEWQAITARHAGGESLASIARSFDCTAPAIRYIVNRHAVEAHSGTTEERASPTSSAAHPAATKAPEVPSPAPLHAIQDIGERITSDFAAFLVALDAVTDQISERSLGLLRESTDRLLRTTARVRIEIDRIDKPGMRAGPRRGLNGRVPSRNM
jgi:transposase-like protein